MMNKKTVIIGTPFLPAAAIRILLLAIIANGCIPYGHAGSCAISDSAEARTVLLAVPFGSSEGQSEPAGQYLTTAPDMLALLEEGDILFQDLDGSPMADAIEKLGPGPGGRRISHSAVILSVKRGVADGKREYRSPICSRDIKAGDVIVLEAYGNVRKVSLEYFLGRSHDQAGRPKVLVMRLKEPFRKFIPQFLERGRAMLGQPFDPYFELDNGMLYCAELIYEMFAIENKPCELALQDIPDGSRKTQDYSSRNTGKVNHLFRLEPMNYIHPLESSVTEFWKFYFLEYLKVDIPQGKPGVSPAGIALSPCLEIVGEFGEMERLE